MSVSSSEQGAEDNKKSQGHIKSIVLEDYPESSPVKEGAKHLVSGSVKQLFQNKLLSQKIVDPDLLPDKSLQYQARPNAQIPLPTQYNLHYTLMDKPIYH